MIFNNGADFSWHNSREVEFPGKDFHEVHQEPGSGEGAVLVVLEGDEGNPQPCGHAEMRPAQGHFLFRANDPVFSDVWYPRSRYKDEIEREYYIGR